jgi:curved DNA-binding protein CbpA/O-acetyl-ADP-ribose deacetylase (regulator of RNase III)
LKKYYQILELEENASLEEIKRQYRLLALRWHPDSFDRNSSKHPARNKEEAEKKFKEINKAYVFLNEYSSSNSSPKTQERENNGQESYREFMRKADERIREVKEELERIEKEREEAKKRNQEWRDNFRKERRKELVQEIKKNPNDWKIEGERIINKNKSKNGSYFYYTIEDIENYLEGIDKKEWLELKIKIMYPALIIDNEPRLHGFSYVLFPISSFGTDYSTANQTNLPYGSALMTDTLDGSGKGSSVLNNKGITHIIHAAPRPRKSFDTDQEFIQQVVKSVQNSIILADHYKFESLAIPLVGGEIYAGSCDKSEIAEGIVIGSLNQLENCQNLKKIIFVEFNNSLFTEAFKKFGDDYSEKAEVKKGDIRDKNLHGAKAIVNAANTYVGFGEGISKAIAEQVGNMNKIDQKAKELIGKFYSSIQKDNEKDNSSNELNEQKNSFLTKPSTYLCGGVIVVGILTVIWIIKKWLTI